MKTLLKAISAIALTGALAMPVLADDTTTASDSKDLKKVIEDQGINYVETAQKGITLSGYVDTSYTEQFGGSGEYAPGSPYTTNPGGGAPNVHSSLRQFDTSNNTFNINAVKIALEKALPDKNDWAAGFRIDTIYGSDAKYLNDTALNGSTNTSGLALEQALVKFRIPVGNGLDIYAGKFVTFLGYEVIESPANLNFSRGLLFTNAIPLTHTGVYADYKFNDTFEAKFGVVDGWNNSTSPSVSTTLGTYNDRNAFGKAITGQLNINAPGKNANITQSFVYSPEGEPGVVGADNGPMAVYDIWGNWSPTFANDPKDAKGGVTDPLLLGFNFDIGYNGASGYPTTDSAASNATLGGHDDSNTWWGGALYAQYKFSQLFSLAGRFEYLHSDAAFDPKFGGGPAGVTTVDSTAGTSTFAPITTPSQDDLSWTLTGTFNIWDNLLTRIEYRVDDLSGSSSTITSTSTGTSATTGDATTITQVSPTSRTAIQQEVSMEAVYSF
jgi:hypothetical protein